MSTQLVLTLCLNRNPYRNPGLLNCAYRVSYWLCRVGLLACERAGFG